MARKRTSDEADTLSWYRLECFKRSRYYEWLRGKLKEAEQEEDASRLERLAYFREMIRSAPVFPIASDGLSWLTVKVALDSPPSVVLASLERLLKEMHDTDDAVEWVLFLHRYGEAVEEILRREPRSALERLADATRPSRARKERVHLKNLKLRLDVWDRFQGGASFSQLASHFKRSASGVRELYAEAALEICASPPPKKGRLRRIQTIVPATHMTTCPKCSKAQREVDFCPAWRAYVNQDYVSLLGRTIKNVSEIPAERPHSGRSKRHEGAE